MALQGVYCGLKLLVLGDKGDINVTGHGSKLRLAHITILGRDRILFHDVEQLLVIEDGRIDVDMRSLGFCLQEHLYDEEDGLVGVFLEFRLDIGADKRMQAVDGLTNLLSGINIFVKAVDMRKGTCENNYPLERDYATEHSRISLLHLLRVIKSKAHFFQNRLKALLEELDERLDLGGVVCIQLFDDARVDRTRHRG